ncbi:hypothetical protein [Candidatus Nitrosocosmicus franklandus]|uniref:Uncharacterized protein n=1 Tax=Candidatus Nitrosocosmicus franklandianus TaxID=1798806 RepID=A0A484I7K0_9ARCH|nr:hypothetical protein [Candidatus Nitrosocosmicus franklandus]VFJ13151.1 conserved membrane protein of unknown function [Candidatus Nitrosocosmicus franklandus]
MHSVRSRTAQIIAAVGLALLLIYFIDVLTSMLIKEPGFLPLTSKDRGLLFGGLSIVLFIISFIVGWKIYSKTLATLLIVGGALIGTSVLVSTFVTPQLTNNLEGFKIVTPPLPQFIGIIIIGYAILGLGIYKAAKNR